jgi:DNA gyrase subunit B
MLSSEQIKNLVVALGTAIGDTFNLSKLRYHKIVIATDADVDGAHIRTLLLTLFFRYFRPVIDGGFLYIAQPPLYKVKRGKEVLYFYTEEEKTTFLKKEGIDISTVEETTEQINTEETEDEVGIEDEEENIEKKKSDTRAMKLSIQRYKGLGEMNAEELWETTMDPENRVLKQVMVEDAQEADRIFDVLMGTDVPSRKSFIQSNARLANVDI